MNDIQSERSKELKKEISEILQLGLNDLENEKYRDSAKKFRQIANKIQKIDEILDSKQKFSERNSLNDLSGKRWLRSTKSWIIADGKRSEIPKEIRNHPGSFPPDLAAHFVEFFTKKDHWVLDPFMGIGSTLSASAKLQRNCWGTELNKNYSQYANKRVQDTNKNGIFLKVFNEDARKIPEIWEKENLPPINFVITSPPYWNILDKSRGGVESTHKKRIKAGFDEKYSENPDDIGNIDTYTDYLDNLTNIFREIKPNLTPKAYICIIVQNIRPKNGIMKPIAWDIANKLSDDYILRQEFIWLQDQKQLGIWGYPSTYVSNVHHHYCLILQNQLEENKR